MITISWCEKLQKFGFNISCSECGTFAAKGDTLQKALETMQGWAVNANVNERLYFGDDVFWELDFFCKNCANNGHSEGPTVLVPAIPNQAREG